MADLFTYLVYTGLLATIIALLCSKKAAFAPAIDGLFETRNNIKIQDIFILLLLTVIVGFRFDVGVDWLGYKEYFEAIHLYKNLSFGDQGMEIGYYWINAFVDFIGGNYTWVFAIAALISWGFILKSFPTKLLPLTFFFLFTDEIFFWSLNGVRQFIALAIFAYSLKYVVHKNLKKYLFYIIIAALFHKSVLLLLPLYFIPFDKLYNRKYWLIAFVLSLIFSKSPFVINGLKTIFSSISTHLSFLEEYNNYLDPENFEAGQMDGTGLGYIFKLIISFLLLFLSKPIIERYPSTKIYFILFFFGIILFNLFFMFQIIGRFAIYFIFFRAYLLAITVFFLYKKRKFEYIGVGIVILYFLLFLSTIYNSSNQCCPYQFAL